MNKCAFIRSKTEGKSLSSRRNSEFEGRTEIGTLKNLDEGQCGWSLS